MIRRIMILLIFFSSLIFPQKIKVEIDPRIELITILESLTTYPLLNSAEFSYKDSIKNYFAKYKDHPAVQKFETMWKAGFNHESPLIVMLHCTMQPEIKIAVPFTTEIDQHAVKRAGNEENINEFVSLLNDFAQKTKYIEFFEGNKKLYDNYLTSVNSCLKKIDQFIDPIKELEDYSGINAVDYKIILAPLNQGGYGPKIKKEGGGFEHIIILGGGVRKFGGKIVNDNPYEDIAIPDLLGFILHEFAHSFVNLPDSLSGELKRSEHLFTPIAGQMKNQGYFNWKTCIDEHIANAFTAKIFIKAVGKQEPMIGKIIKDNFLKNGFIYIDQISDILNEYENNRDKYKTFEEFKPVLVNRLETMNN